MTADLPPTDPTDPTDEGATDDHGSAADLGPAADRVRRTFAAVADGHPATTDGWATVRARIAAGDTGAPVLGTLPRATTSRPSVRRSRRVLAAAAVLVALAGIGATVALTRGNDDGSSLNADEPATGEPTGWYVPVGLPDGWSLDTVELTRTGLSCPCRQVVWSDAGWDQRLLWTEQAPLPGGRGAGTGPDIEELDLGDGVTGELAVLGDDETWYLHWSEGDRDHLLTATGIGVDQAPVLAARVRNTAGGAPPAMDGLTVRSEQDGATLADEVQLDVTLRTPGDGRARYSLGAPAAADALTLAYGPEEQTLPGQPLPVLTSRHDLWPGGTGSTPDALRDYVGRWPGATVRIGGPVGLDADGAPTAAAGDTDTLVAALRPATAEEWKAFVASARTQEPGVADSSTLADLVAGRTAAGPEAEPPSSDPSGDPAGADEPTGWYAPAGLPEGWKLQGVSVTPSSAACTSCRLAVWSDETWERRLQWSTQPLAEGEDGRSLDDAQLGHVDLGDGVTASLAEQGDNSWTMTWPESGVHHALTARGIDAGQAPAIAAALRDDPAVDAVPVDGLVLRSDVAADPFGDAQVLVTYRAPSGNRVDYSLASPALADVLSLTYGPEEQVLAGQPLPVLGPSGLSDDPSDVIGRWPGATARGTLWSTTDSSGGGRRPSVEENQTLFAALRPVSAAEWRAFVASAENADAAATAHETLADLVADR